ncbi:putative intracellular protease/amidase [Sphingobacterium paludis]|uniref:Putative intracellular protease/amidase n=2 Tax=Sphingobacterium paludis TaxID=1476465 RepID=A0A4V3E1A0_9SPHI|nr:putative intracellular protease/amidase [Sphingobacterium paludis]
MKNAIKLFFIISLFAIFCPAHAQDKAKSVLMVVSSYGEEDPKFSFEMDEFSQAYLIFEANGLTISVASPKGGNVEAGQFNKDKEYNSALLAHPKAIEQLKNTLKISDLKANDFQAIYIVGGKGPLFDLYREPSLEKLILEMTKNRSVISAICHGSIALAGIKEGKDYLIKGIKLTGFSEQEDIMFGKSSNKLPVLLESALKANEAVYLKAEPMLPFLVVDGRFVTGQNPYSTTLVAEVVVKELDLDPVTRTPYRDEMSMRLVSKVLKGDLEWGKAELKKNMDMYDLELIAVYGYYRAMHANEDKQSLGTAVSIVELVTPYYFQEDLYHALATHYIKLNNIERAKEVLNTTLLQVPEHKASVDLLKQIN